MARPSKHFVPGRAAAPHLIQMLEQVCTISGHRPHQVFEDWVRLCEATLVELPRHAAMMQAEGRLRRHDEDHADTQALWNELERRYHRRWSDCAAIFRTAFHTLLVAAEDGISDILGSMFHQWELSNHWKGQFFTPFDVGLMLAQMNDPTALIHERLKAALTHPDNECGQMLLLAGAALDGVEAQTFFVEQLIPAALSFYEPVKVCDPAVGSGCLLLAMAAIIPAWANTYGLVQLYGQDIDRLCVAMCRVQCMIFGLNGYALHLYLAATGATNALVDSKVPIGMVPVLPEDAADTLALVEADAPLELVEGYA